jgi:hypothetical protein
MDDHFPPFNPKTMFTYVCQMHFFGDNKWPGLASFLQFFIAVLGMHCGIYKISSNISNMSLTS